MAGQSDFIDFASAEHFLHQAQLAHEGGDQQSFVACLKLLSVALRMDDAINPIGLGTGRQHLPAKRSPSSGAT